jgi:hypothetical protein
VPKARKATLNGAAALSTDDLWAVGSSTPEGEPRATATLAMRWDGSVWTIVSTPSPPGHHKATSTLAAVATAGGELTAVGSYRAHGYWNALIERCR